jgi:hypothetical protein
MGLLQRLGLPEQLASGSSPPPNQPQPGAVDRDPQGSVQEASVQAPEQGAEAADEEVSRNGPPAPTPRPDAGAESVQAQ